MAEKKTHKIIPETLKLAPKFYVECKTHKVTSVSGSVHWKDVDCEKCLKLKNREQKLSPIYGKLAEPRMGTRPDQTDAAIDALEELVLRFPIDGWAIDGKTCKCLQYEDHGACRHLRALTALQNVRIG